MTAIKAIQELIRKIEKDPYIFHTENDIQSMLYMELRKEYPKLFEIKLKRNTDSKYKTSLVHTEYFAGSGRKIDVVVFSKEDTHLVNDNWLRIKNLNYSHVRLDDAIEIKYDMGIYGKKGEKIIRKDLDKLVKLKDSGRAKNVYFIYIYRGINAKPKTMEKVKKITDIIREYSKKDVKVFYKSLWIKR